MLRKLPKDVLTYLCLRINIDDLAKLRQAYSEIDKICEKNLFWLQKIQHDFEIDIDYGQNLENYYSKINFKID